MKKVMFDTNVFNRIIKEDIDIGPHEKHYCYFVTVMQHAEILKTRNAVLRKKLLDGFIVINEATFSTELEAKSSPWGALPWGKFAWGADGGHYDKIRNQLDQQPNKKKDRGNIYDALIIETCLLEGITLVTEERAIHNVCSTLNIECLYFDTFLELQSDI